MTDNTSLVNLALQTFGSRTVITAAQLAAGSNNEAKQANLVFENCRDSLLRMAPWDCGMKTANLVYITSVPGTPENTSPATTLWEPGQPRPPWAYEYQYPVDCLRACWIIPATQTGYAGGVPITTAVTGGAPTLWNGTPIRFKVGIDSFRPVTAAAVVSGGTGYAVGDEITLVGTTAGDPPIGAPVSLRVLTAPAGVVATVEVVNQVIGSVPAVGGSYFDVQSGTIAQDTTTGSGTGATFTLTQGAAADQRVIYTNQEFATLCYVRQVTDPNVWDPQFQDAFVQFLGANIVFALTGDKGLANNCIAETNRLIGEARKSDGNEGLTINDVTPDFIRARGISWTDGLYSGPYSSFDWGGLLPTF
jgi:hypothetical protein